MKNTKIRVQAGTNIDGYTMDIVDDLSGVMIARMKLTHEEIGRLAASQQIKIDAEILDDVSKIGMVYQTKRVDVPVPHDHHGDDFDQCVESSAYTMAADGWMPDMDLWHRSQKSYSMGGTFTSVSYYRWVSPDDADGDGVETCQPNPEHHTLENLPDETAKDLLESLTGVSEKELCSERELAQANDVIRWAMKHAESITASIGGC